MIDKFWLNILSIIGSVISIFAIVISGFVGYWVSQNDKKIDKVESRIETIERDRLGVAERDIYFIRSELSYLKGSSDAKSKMEPSK